MQSDKTSQLRRCVRGVSGRAHGMTACRSVEEETTNLHSWRLRVLVADSFQKLSSFVQGAFRLIVCELCSNGLEDALCAHREEAGARKVVLLFLVLDFQSR